MAYVAQNILKPDLDVFTDIAIPIEYYRETLKRQAVVNPGLRFILIDEASGNTEEFYYEKGIEDYVKELARDTGFTSPQYYEATAKGSYRKDKLSIK